MLSFARFVCVWERERDRVTSQWSVQPVRNRFNRGSFANTYEHHHCVCHAILFPSRAWSDGKTKDIINCLYFHFESCSWWLWNGHYISDTVCGILLFYCWDLFFYDYFISFYVKHFEIPSGRISLKMCLHLLHLNIVWYWKYHGPVPAIKDVSVLLAIGASHSLAPPMACLQELGCFS